MRRALIGTLVVIGLILAVMAAQAFEMTPAAQAEIDRQKAAVVSWAAHPVVVAPWGSSIRRFACCTHRGRSSSR